MNHVLLMMMDAWVVRLYPDICFSLLADMAFNIWHPRLTQEYKDIEPDSPVQCRLGGMSEIRSRGEFVRRAHT